MTPSNVKEIVVKKWVFDLDKFEKVRLEAKVNFTPVSSVAEAVERVGNDQARLLEVINSGLERDAKIGGRKELVGSGNIGNPATVSQFVRTFSQMAPFNVMPETTVDEKKAKRQAIYAFIRSIPQLMEGVKSASASAVDDEEDDPEPDEN